MTGGRKRQAQLGCKKTGNRHKDRQTYLSQRRCRRPPSPQAAACRLWPLPSPPPRPRPRPRCHCRCRCHCHSRHNQDPESHRRRPQPGYRRFPPQSGRFFCKKNKILLTNMIWVTNTRHRSFSYDPIRSKTNIVHIRTIRIVRKRTMTNMTKKYTKNVNIKMQQIKLERIDFMLPISLKIVFNSE